MYFVVITSILIYFNERGSFGKIASNTTQTLLRPEFTDERRAEIRKLMIALRRDFPQLNRAAAWYQSLLERKPEENLEPYTHLSFLDNIPDEGLCPHDFELGPPKSALIPHRLEVTFHRRS